MLSHTGFGVRCIRAQVSAVAFSSVDHGSRTRVGRSRSPEIADILSKCENHTCAPNWWCLWWSLAARGHPREILTPVTRQLLLGIIEGSLEVKLPTIWTDEKQSREEAERRERLEERRVEEKEYKKKDDADA